MNSTYIIILSLYMAISMAIAFLAGRKNTKDASDYNVGGRSMGPVILFFTLLATIVGASSVLTASYQYYKEGISYILYFLGIAISYAIYVFYLNNKINDFGHHFGGETVGDWISFRYGRTAGYIASVLIAVAYIGITAFQYIAMASILSMVTGLSFNFSMAITVLVIVIYTSFGGLWAVAATDVVQGAMTLIGIIIMVPVFIKHAGGFEQMIANVPADHLSLFGSSAETAAEESSGGALSSVASLLVFALGIISWPDLWQRCYAAKDRKTLKMSMLAFIIASFMLGVVMIFVGFSANTLVTDPSAYDSSTMLPALIMQYISPVGGALLLSSLLAVIMGTADSTLLVSSVIVDKDLIRPFIKKELTDEQSLKMSKIVTLVTGLAVLLVLFVSTDIFELWVMSADITGATLAVPILLGFCWKRPGKKAGLAAIIAGFIGWIVSYTGLINTDAIILGATMSLVAYILFAFIDKKDSERVLY